MAPPTVVSSSGEELTGSEKDVTDRETDVFDSDNEIEGNGAESENDVVKVEDDSETDDEQPIGLLKKPRAGASSSKAPAARSSSSSKALAAVSDSETESDRGYDSVSSPDSDGFTVRQIVAMPEKKVAAARRVAGSSRRRLGKKPAVMSRPSGLELEKKGKRKTKKVEVGVEVGVGVGEGVERSEKKKKKKEVEGGDGAAKKPGKRAMFQRVWSEEDEIALLEGLAEYERQKGTDPFQEMDVFFEFIKNSIRVKVTPTQMVNKARRMRRKYAKNVCRGKEGKDPSFKRPHDRLSFEVSKTVWGDGKLIKTRSNRRGRPFGTGKRAAAAAAGASGSRNEEVIKKEEGPQRKRRKSTKKVIGGDLWSRFPCMRDSIDIFPYLPDWGKKLMTEKLIHSPNRKLSELEEKWKELKEAVSQVHLRHIRLLKETLTVQEETYSLRH